jgi:hypothetical protein
MTRGPRPRPRRRDPCPYTYEDENGREVFQHVRWRLDPPVPRPKSFSYRWRQGPGLALVNRKPDAADRYLYRLPELLAALTTAVAIYWTEGERCCDALRALGAVATSHHGGAGKATRAQARWFKGYRGTVILVADRDAPGAADALRRYELLRAVGIPSSRLLVVRARVPGLGADAADHVAAGLGLDDFKRVRLSRLREVAATVTPADYRNAGYWT